MDLANDERLNRLNEMIQMEADPHRLYELIEEFQRLIDERRSEERLDLTAENPGRSLRPQPGVLD